MTRRLRSTSVFAFIALGALTLREMKRRSPGFLDEITNEVLARLNGDWTTDAAGSGSRLRAKGRGL